MLWGIIFWLLFLSAAGYVLVRGDLHKRLAIGIMIFGVVATTIAYGSGSHKWLPLNITVLTIDVVALIAFAWIARVSREKWPLLLVGWQIATVTIHIASIFAVSLLPNAYGISQGIWSFLQFGTLFAATVLARRKRSQN